MGRETVRGAARVGNDVVLGDVELVVVDADDDGDVLALGRSGYDDLFRAGGDVALGLLGFGVETGRFDDVFDTELAPGKSGGAFAHGETLDLVAVDDEQVVLGDVGRRFFARDRAVELALRGVVLQQVSEIVRWHQIVDGDDIDGRT